MAEVRLSTCSGVYSVTWDLLWGRRLLFHAHDLVEHGDDLLERQIEGVTESLLLGCSQYLSRLHRCLTGRIGSRNRLIRRARQKLGRVGIESGHERLYGVRRDLVEHGGAERCFQRRHEGRSVLRGSGDRVIADRPDIDPAEIALDDGALDR